MRDHAEGRNSRGGRTSVDEALQVDRRRAWTMERSEDLLLLLGRHAFEHLRRDAVRELERRRRERSEAARMRIARVVSPRRRRW